MNEVLKFRGYFAGGELWELLCDLKGMGKKGQFLYRKAECKWYVVDFEKAVFNRYGKSWTGKSLPLKLDKIRDIECKSMVMPHEDD